MITRERAKAEWERRQIRQAEAFDQVFHTAHVDTALRILEDGVIRAGLVFDKSRMQETRMQVSWVSPNEWYEGSRYGNIAFDIPFLRLRKAFPAAYWIETASYKPLAPRFLLSKNKDHELPRYFSQNNNGPWRFSPNSGHRRERSLCLEFMIEGDLDLNLVSGIRFFNHHPQGCSEIKRNGGQACRHLGHDAGRAGAHFMAGLVGRFLTLRGLSVQRTSVRVAWNYLRDELEKLPTSPGAVLSRRKKTHARSLLHAFYARKPAVIKDYSSLFKSSEFLIETVREVLSEEFPDVVGPKRKVRDDD